METPTLLYWITRLDEIGAFFCIFGVLAGLIAVICAFVWADIEPEYDTKDKKATKVKKTLKRSLLAAIIMIFIAVFIPSTKDAYIIYGVGNTIDYIKSNDTAKQLPDKAILALDKLFDEINEPKSTQTK